MKLLTQETCPNCKHNFESEKELEGLEAVRHEGKIKEIQTEQKPEPKPEIKEVEKIIVKRPSDLPTYTCKNCGDLHKNPDYSKKVTHKCADGRCGQFTANPKKPCKWCGNTEFEELDEDTLAIIPDPDHQHEDD